MGRRRRRPIVRDATHLRQDYIKDDIQGRKVLLNDTRFRHNVHLSIGILSEQRVYNVPLVHVRHSVESFH